jgi:energy-coupling factor transporter ATP-binding protein EcfA2
MKLLGIEFIDFACFERQFIKLPDGLLLLVGKNNAGKTAILRGLSVLSALPIGENRPVTFNMAPYCRRQQPQSHYEFHIIFGAEIEDFRLFSDADDNWSRLMLEKEPYFRFIFKLWPNPGMISWGGAELLVDKYHNYSPVPIIEMTGGGAVLVAYPAIMEQGAPQLGTRRGASMMPGVTNVVAPDGSRSTVIRRDQPIIAAALELTKTKLVSAHRVPHPSMSLQSITDLPADATTLAGYLQTLQNNDRSNFEKVEAFLTAVFPEFKYVNPSNRNNQAAITITDKADNEIPLTHCGTGVEQLLSLATFALTAPHGSMLLMDEPHSFLHPSAERKLVEFIQQNSKSHFVVSTHSPILMNSILADRIIHLQPPGSPFALTSKNSDGIPKILLELGYKNSDVLFNDRLIAVEGESDKEILRILLANHHEIPRGEIDRTGFPVMEGAGNGALALQTAVLRFEKLLDAIGRAKQPRIYLFDGDKSPEDQKLLAGTKYAELEAPIAFLARSEIENYLLHPMEIAEAIRHQAAIDEVALPQFDTDMVRQEMLAILTSNEERIFPNGKHGDPLIACKGSRVLERLFEKFGTQKYEKKRSGVLLATLIKQSGHADIGEIILKVKSLF